MKKTFVPRKFVYQFGHYALYIWSKILSSSLDALLKLSKTTFPKKMFPKYVRTKYIFWRGVRRSADRRTHAG